MSDEGGNAPSWLFSFVDLAFLSMIAMTQLASDPSKPAPDLGEMIVPTIGKEATTELSAGAVDFWQLRVHPPNEEEVAPFELIHAVDGELSGEGERLEVAILRERLEAMLGAANQKPLLAPHEDSRSQDMLDAAALIEEFWPSRRRALVAHNFEPS